MCSHGKGCWWRVLLVVALAGWAGSLHAAGWRVESSGTLNDLNGAAWDGKQFVAVGNAGTILTSQDGQNWAQQSTIRKDLTCVISTTHGLVAGGGTGEMFGSSDGSEWSAHKTDFSGKFTGLVSNNSLILAVRGDRTIVASDDGVNWSNQSIEQANGLQLERMRMKYNPAPQAGEWSGNKFVLVGAAVIASPDGDHWTWASNGPGRILYGITNNGTLAVAVGEEGTITASSDGQTWVPRESGTKSRLNACYWTGRYFVAVGAAGTILFSEDGMVWNKTAADTTLSLNALTGNGSMLVIVGAGGTVLTARLPAKSGPAKP
jgi:hypothetical protein